MNLSPGPGASARSRGCGTRPHRNVSFPSPPPRQRVCDRPGRALVGGAIPGRAGGNVEHASILHSGYGRCRDGAPRRPRRVSRVGHTSRPIVTAVGASSGMTALASTEPRRGRPRVRARHVLPYAGLDSSFEVGLSMAFRQHLQWGTQVVYTYGPYEFVDHLVYVRFGTWLLGLGAALGVHLLFFAVLAGYVRALGGAWWHWALATGVLALPLAEFISTEYECMLGALLLLHMAAIASSFRRALLLSSLAGCLLALLILIKGTGMISAAAL